MNVELREEIREKTEIGGKKELAFNLMVRFLNSDGCGWICIALGWQWPTFPLLPSF